MLVVSTATPLPAIYAVLAWASTAVALWVAATMCAPKWRRLVSAAACATLFAAYLFVWLPPCDDVPWWWMGWCRSEESPQP